ncbi:MAG: hypothetical protein LC750_11755 [Actinobacteria bacterium]|nr:hypothetical protein [Actinomycetota bacterium]
MMRKPHRYAFVAIAVAILSALPLAMRASGEETDLGGYQMSASATAISVIYNQPSFGLPTDPTFELRKVHSISNTDSGPSGRALASVAWPGDAAGNADPALLLDLVMFDPTRAGSVPQIDDLREALKSGIAGGCETNSCTYPLRAEAFYPEAEGHPSSSQYASGGVVDMIANAREGRSDGTTVTKEVGPVNGFFIGAMSSRTVTEVRRGVAISSAITHLEDVSLLGLVSFASIDTVARVTSDGVTATPTTATKITGMSFDAQCQQPNADQKTCHVPIYVDGNGFHASNASQDPLGQYAKPLLDQLRENGFDVILTPASKRVEKESAYGFGTVDGLIIRMNSKGMNKLIDAIPDENVRNWIRSPSSKSSPLYEVFKVFSPTIAGYVTSMTQADQTFSIVLGDAAVDAAAAPMYNPDEEPVIDIPIDNGGVGIPVAPGGFAGGGFTGGTTPLASGGGQLIIDAVPVGVKGLPGSAAALALLLGVLAAFVLRRFADGATATTVAEVCPLETAR